jgi:hypothetical protein
MATLTTAMRPRVVYSDSLSDYWQLKAQQGVSAWRRLTFVSCITLKLSIKIVLHNFLLNKLSPPEPRHGGYYAVGATHTDFILKSIWCLNMEPVDLTPWRILRILELTLTLKSLWWFSDSHHRLLLLIIEILLNFMRKNSFKNLIK